MSALSILDVFASGAVYASSFEPRVIVTASDHVLIAWASPDGFTWRKVATRAGGAALFTSALALAESATNWLAELIRTGRAK